VRDLSGIMRLESSIEILGKPSVMMGTFCFADENVDVMEAHTEVWAGSRLRTTLQRRGMLFSDPSTKLRSKMKKVACQGVVRNVYMRCEARLRADATMPWQAPFSFLRTKPGGGGGNRTPVRECSTQGLYRLRTGLIRFRVCPCPGGPET
jgi:hypothetical protein